MQEMLEAADADQDGVLNYDEFLTIMDQFGVTASSGANQWVVKEDGTLETEMASGASFGEESIQGERPLRATITALKIPTLSCWTGPTMAASWPTASANSTCCRSCTRCRRS